MLPKRHVRTFLVHLVLVQNRFPDTSVSAAGVLLVSCRVVWDASEINCGSILHLSGLDPLDWSFSIHKPRSGFLVCCQYDTSRSFGIPTAVKRVLWGSWGLGNKIAPSFGSWDFKVAGFILLQSILTWSNPLMACFIMWWNWFPSAYCSI